MAIRNFFQTFTTLALLASSVLAVPQNPQRQQPTAVSPSRAQQSAAPAVASCNNSPGLCQTPYNQVTFLGAHNSPFIRDETTSFSVSGNHFYNTTVQLAAGVRLLSGQVHKWNPGDSDKPSDSNLHMCHGPCRLLDAGSLRGWLREIKAWMDRPSNANEVVTILLVNADSASAAEIDAEYVASGMREYSTIFDLSVLSTGAWPLLASMIQSRRRVVNWVTNLPDNAAAPYLMDEFTYVFENDFDNQRPSEFSCQPNRPSTVGNNPQAALASGRLFLQNHFLYEAQAFFEVPDVDNVNVTNAIRSAPHSLGSKIAECTQVYGRKPNYVLVDFFNVGPAVSSVDIANGLSGTNAPVGRQMVGSEVRSREFVQQQRSNDGRRLGAASLSLFVAVAAMVVLGS